VDPLNRVPAVAVLVALILGLGASACGEPARLDEVIAEAGRVDSVQSASGLQVRYARYFTVSQRDGFTVVTLEAPLRDSSAAGGAQVARAEFVLVPRGGPAPSAQARGTATAIEIPARRLALNSNNEEAFLAEIGALDRLVAVGGANSYDDSIRARVLRGEIKQIGYGWHRAPDLDVAVAARPDLLILRVLRPDDTPSLERARALGLTTIPFLGEAEPTYLGKAEWIKFFGLLTGRAATADSVFSDVVSRVDSLRGLVASRRPRTVFWVYHWSADKWNALVRGPIAQMLEHAGGRNVFAQPENVLLSDEERISTERLTTVAGEAECWFAGDGFPQPLPRDAITTGMRAWRERCVFFNNGRVKPEADAWDWFHRAPVRPDHVLAELIRALHGDVVSTPFGYLVANTDYTKAK